MTNEQLTSILVHQQLLTPSQQAQILEQADASADHPPILEMVAQAFGPNENDLLTAVANDIHSSIKEVKLSQMPHDPPALAYLSAADAWDYLILPLAVEPDGSLLCCTTDETLPTALAYLLKTLAIPFRLVIAEVRPLEQFIAEQYHYEGVEIDAA